MISPQRLLVTSIVRLAGHEERSGFVRVIEGGSGRILSCSPFAESPRRSADPNPRGGLRGVRGASVWGDRLVIANAEELFLFDCRWRLIRRMTHPWLGGIHDVLAERDGIWVTATSADLLLKLGWDGRLLADWEWRRHPELYRPLGLPPLPPVERRTDFRDPEALRGGVANTVHLNSVTRGRDGLLLSFGRVLSATEYRRARRQSRLGALAHHLRLPRRPAALPPQAAGGGPGASSSALLLLLDDGRVRLLKRLRGTRVPNHNVLQIGSRLVFNDSNQGRLVATSIDDPAEFSDLSVEIPGEPSFIRGLAPADSEGFWVGAQGPAAIHRADPFTGRLLESLRLGGLPRETVYAICPLPPSFSNPPQRLLP